ncbi:MAG: hypothetical protein M3421_12160 [Bacteroidota bacterium]|nr:hypothetical protein [Bacteroidota bacterium]
MQYVFKIFILFSLLLVHTGCSNAVGDNAHPDIKDYFDLHWARKSYWDDGKAEVAKYTAERIIYGKVRNFEYTFILVKEDFNEEFNVKTDNYKRKDLFNVMKVNQFCRIETDNYPYHFMSSFFYRRENPILLHKATISSQEWCGNTFKAYNTTEEYYNFNFNSYWDNQGEGSYQLDKDALFEDQLSYSLRSLKFKEGLNFDYRIIENQVSNKADKPLIYHATITVNTSLANENLWKVVVTLDNVKVNEYQFEKTYPNVLVSQNTWDRRNMILQSLERNEYWKINKLQ